MARQFDSVTDYDLQANDCIYAILPNVKDMVPIVPTLVQRRTEGDEIKAERWLHVEVANQEQLITLIDRVESVRKHLPQETKDLRERLRNQRPIDPLAN